MKKFLLVTILCAATLAWPLRAQARVDIGINISLPPPIAFASPPELVVIPETYIYALPDPDAEIFFYRGWWWRLWEGRWYRSHQYSSGWRYYRKTPSFYRGLPSDWRDEYREGRWRGRPWEQQRIPHRQVQRDWRTWERSGHWERNNTWGVQGLPPKAAARPQARERRPAAREFAPQPQMRPQSRRVEQSPPNPPPSRGEHPQWQPRHGRSERGPEESSPANPRHGRQERGQREKHDRE